MLIILTDSGHRRLGRVLGACCGRVWASRWVRTARISTVGKNTKYEDDPTLQCYETPTEKVRLDILYYQFLNLQFKR